MDIWAAPLLYGLGVLAALEILYLVLKRLLPEFNVNFVYHMWVVLLATLLILVSSGFERDTLTWKLTAATTAVLSAWIAFALVSAAIIKRPWTPEKPFLPKLVRDVLRIGLLIAVALTAANLILGVDLSTIVVSSTVLSAVAGLALQDVLKNFFAGMALDLEKPFKRGDCLLLDGTTAAEVIDLGWRTVHLRTKEGVDLFEPNARLSDMRLLNYGAGKQPRALAFRIGLPYETPPAEVKRVLKTAAQSVPGAVESPPIAVFLESFDDHSISYYMRVWTHSVHEMAKFRDAVQSRVWYELERRGLGIPFPIRDVHLRSAKALEKDRAASGLRRASRRLSQLELFKELNPDIVRALAADAATHHYDAGEILVREGDQGQSLFVIDSGAVVISKVSADGGGAEIDVGRLTEGDFFGEQSLLTGEARNATVRSDSGCAVLEITKPQLAHVLAADSGIAEILSRALATRNEVTAASLERYRDRLRSQREAESAESILRRMRAFFGLKTAPEAGRS